MDYELIFKCRNDSMTRICTSDMSIEKAKNLHGQMFTCVTDNNGESDCQSYLLSPKYFPNPVTEGDFKPSTKGGPANLKGYYLAIGLYYITIVPNIRLMFVGNLNTNSIDVTNLILDYKGGCGSRTIKWPNGYKYDFNHSSPEIDNISIGNSSFIASGSNFVPRSKGGSITIIGERLSSQVNNSITTIKLGQNDCKNVISLKNEITCNLESIPNVENVKLVDLQVNISINGINFIIPQGQVKIIGDCLGSSQLTQVYIDDLLQSNITTNINEKETTLSFKPIQPIENQSCI
ncbi:hypothetical protein ACTFIU_010928 [Dictyostelium citrinum]